MKALTNEDFVKRVMDCASPERPFQPSATYDPDGDCIEFVIKPDDFYARRVDDLLTVYYSEETNELTGSFFKSVKAFCKKLIQQSPAFAVVVEKPPVRLSHLFMARLLQLPGGADQKELRMLASTYRELIAWADKDNIEVPGDACTT